MPFELSRRVILKNSVALDVCPMQHPLITERFLPATEPEMALNNTDKAWITLEIQNALKRKGWGKLTGFVKDWSGTSAAVGILIFLITQWGAYTEFKTRTGDRLDTIEKQIGTIQGDIRALRLSQSAATPSSSQSIEEAKRIVNEAKTSKVPIPVETIERTGKEFVEAAKHTAGAWEVVLELASYRSDINAGNLPSLSRLRKAPQDSGYDIIVRIQDATKPGPPSVTGKDAPAEVWLAGDAPAETSAKVEYFDNPPQRGSTHAQYILIDWLRPEINFGLDNIYLKNVIIKNAVVVYLGGPIKLENVYFVNCTFKYGLTPPGLNLGSQLLASASVTFSNPS